VLLDLSYIRIQGLPSDLLMLTPTNSQDISSPQIRKLFFRRS
jgi:hypothetical protein